MSVEKPKENIFTTSTTVRTTTTSSNDSRLKQRVYQNHLLIWLDANIDRPNTSYQNMITQLQSFVDNIKIFTQSDECIDFLTDMEDMKALLIIEGSLSQQVIFLVHDIPQLDAIYIFCSNESTHTQWIKKSTKVKGVYMDIPSICKSLQGVVKQNNQNSIPISIVEVNKSASSQNLNQLEPSFMYTQIFKEILLGIKHNVQAFKDFIVYCRNGNYSSPTNITRFESEYNAELAIWWYTSPLFIYSMLNSALRKLEGNTIINMGFFICDLHQQIEELHKKQISTHNGDSFIVYRGQGLSTMDFEKLRKTDGGLLSFNNFLSTSKKSEVSLVFAESSSTETDMVGILFVMFIDPTISSAPFATIDGFSYFNDEEEILFSMHTVFRIGKITQIDKDNPLYQVELTLTTDDDSELRILTERIREEHKEGTGWGKLGMLLVNIGQFDKAEELYITLLEQTTDDSEKAVYYNNLGLLKNIQGDYEKAILNHKQAFEIDQKSLLESDSLPAISNNNIGLVYDEMGEYSKAISFFEKALEIYRKTLPSDHPSLASCFNSIGLVYSNMGEYSNALSFYTKALEIRQETLPSNHPSLGISYNNLGSAYDNKGEYSNALSFYEKALEIYKKALPPNHPLLTVSYNNLGSVYDHMGEYSNALSFYEKALEIYHKTLPSNHPSMATSYNNVGSAYDQMGAYPKALSFYAKALEIYRKTLPSNHPSLATSYSNVGLVYANMGEYSNALSFYEKALEIRQETLTSNHPLLGTSYHNIGSVYDNMKDYIKALLFHEKALELYQKTLPENHPFLTASYNNIGEVYRNMGEYSKALSFYEKALEMDQKTLPPSHPSLATYYNNIGMVYDNTMEYTKALLFYEKALEIDQKTLPENHPYLAITYNNIGWVFRSMENYSKALSYLERARDILELSSSPDHPDLESVRKSIDFVKEKLSNNV